MRILFILSKYKIGDGVSGFVKSEIERHSVNDYDVVAKWLVNKQEGLNIWEYNEEKLMFKIKNCGYDLIHYIKGCNSDILNLVIKCIHKCKTQIPVLTTICQSPSYKSLLLSPFEIKSSNHFVFIDKTSYNDPLIKFIPLLQKSQIYLSSKIEDFVSEKIEYKMNNPERFIIGRGTTLSKCPKEMFDVFDRIDCPNKEFHIVGVPKEGNWVAEEAAKRDNVIMHGHLPYVEWVDICKTFDLVLYHIPKVCHASIDANLGLAMALKKPVVYYGSDAPKERFINGKNGYVAETLEELIKYSNLLVKNYEMRKRIGEEAQKSIPEIIGTYEDRIKKFNKVYKSTKENFYSKVKIPFSYYILYVKRAWKRIIKEKFGIYRMNNLN